MYKNFLHETFYIRLNYSNKAVIHINHMKLFLYTKFYHENILHENIYSDLQYVYTSATDVYALTTELNYHCMKMRLYSLLCNRDSRVGQEVGTTFAIKL